MTRPRPDSERFFKNLPESVSARLKTVYSPLIKIGHLNDQIVLSDMAGVIFSSANSVEAVARQIRFADIPCYCVGEATTRLATEHGWQATCMGATSDGLVQTMIDRRVIGPLLHLSGAHARGDIAERLTAAGCQTRRQIVYDQQTQLLSTEACDHLNGEEPVIVPLFSPRTAQCFADQWAATAPVHAIALSAAVAEPIEGLPLASLRIAASPDARSVGLEVEKTVDLVCSLEGDPGPQ
jgi:uroporphyrinogen-III synthase